MTHKTGNMYEFVNQKPNPLAGECSHKCGYCYVTKMKARYPKLKEKYSGKPRVYPSVLSNKYKESDFVFVCDCNDLFAHGVTDDIIIQILKHYHDCPAQLFFQTKNPLRILEFIEYIPKEAIICTTIETNRMYHKLMGFTSLPQTRSFALRKLTDSGYLTQVTVEPIMDFDMDAMIDLIRYTGCIQVNIGADSGRNNLPEPHKDKIAGLILRLIPFTTVKQKTNLKRLLK